VGIGEGKDFKLDPGRAPEWDWNETGTRHCGRAPVAGAKPQARGPQQPHQPPKAA